MADGDTDSPLALTRAEMIALDAREATVRVEGRLASGRRLPTKAMLVIELEGRRHRFPQGPPAARGRDDSPDAWTAIFTIPAWLEPQLTEQSFLIVGDATLPLPGSAAAGELEPPGREAPARRSAARETRKRAAASARRSAAAVTEPGEAGDPGGEPAAAPSTTVRAVQDLLDELRRLDTELEAWQASAGD